MVALSKLSYKFVPGLLSQDEIAMVRSYCKQRHYENFDSFDVMQNNNGDTYFYKDPLMQTILQLKKPVFEKATGIDLLETYTFWRCYTYNAILEKHKDRPSCEISATVCIDSDHFDWPIYMDGKPLVLQAGDAVIYNGCDVEHWREAFPGDYHMQVFLHYVDAKGPYKDHKGDQINENSSRS
tara:strand:+ start:4103 stop:4648 length:546 start_codon:yes stop_codon:yes gene_type:complete